ncbi:MAG: MFS transporter [Pirellulales bacterium]|nr:MFS transporter [Pirellulales bacterium]
MMLSIVLLYRYADLVTYLGGSEFHLGWIVGVGMIGAIAVRPSLGRLADRYGAARLWWVCAAVLAACSFAHLTIQSHNGPTIYLLRIVYSASVAGLFGASVTWICGRVPPARTAEVIGMIGSSGFAAMALGSQLADLLLGTREIVWEQIQRMFLWAGALATAALVLAYLASRGSPRPTPRRRPPLAGLLRRYSPAAVLVAGVSTGMALNLPNTFLRPFAADLGTSTIGLFFTVYALTALVTRVSTRRMPERFGLHRMILVGTALLVAAMLCFAWVREPWQLAVPAFVLGIAHAIVFPPLIAAGSQAFPLRHRGTGTMLVWAFFDLGALIGAPLAGVTLHVGEALGLPAYPTMFAAVAALVGIGGLAYVRWAPARTATTSSGVQVVPRRRRRAVRPVVRPPVPVASAKGLADVHSGAAGAMPSPIVAPCEMDGLTAVPQPAENSRT